MRYLFPSLITILATSSRGDEPKTLLPLAEEARRIWSAPGLAVVVVKGNQTLLISGIGTRDHTGRNPVSADTLFPIGSCTKAFTSATIASLVLDGTISFDDPVSKHLPWFKLSDPHANALVTLRDLLSHRTGLNGHDLLWYRAPWTLEESVKRIADLELAGPFRGSFHYSSLTVAAAGMAAANASGKSWEQLVRERIAKPLDMKQIAFTSKQVATFADRAEGFRQTDAGKIEPMPAYDMKEPHPAGSIHLSARELEKWLRYQLSNASPALAETRMPQTVVPMTDAVKPYHPHATQVSYGMGWLIYDYRGKRVVAHGGMIDGFRTQITLLPEEKIGIAIVNNLHESKLNLALTLSIVDQLLDLPKSDWNKHFRDLERAERKETIIAFETAKKNRRADLAPSAALDRFVGDYRNAAYGTGKVTEKAGRLIWSWSSFEMPLDHWEGDTFRIAVGRFENHFVEFRVTPNGVTAIRFAERIYERK